MSSELAQAVLQGNRLALARTLTQVENDTSDGRDALNVLFAHTGRAHLIGVTGAPGTGKSSLVNQLARYYRNPPEGPARRVAIVAVDPSSPFTGGAILGDRIRMRDLSGDPGVFIRSMASRGSLGGLASTTASMVQVFDAAGFDVILIETVGAGQAEVDIVRLAHTTLVIEAPGMGDDIQAIKAGILEIADILVINKADRPGVENTERALRGMLELAHPLKRSERHHGRLEEMSITGVAQDDHTWIPPIQRTICAATTAAATQPAGIQELATLIHHHRKHLEQSGEWHTRDRERLQTELMHMVQEALVRRWQNQLADHTFIHVLDDLISRQISPHQAVQALLNGDF
jgi:LAO/AO transport system kinase